MLSCNIGNYVIKRQSERYIIILVMERLKDTKHYLAEELCQKANHINSF